MSAGALGARTRKTTGTPWRGRKPPSSPAPRPLVVARQLSPEAGGSRYSFVDLGDSARLALMLVPQGRGAFQEQAKETLSMLRDALQAQQQPMTVTLQTVFLRDARDEAECERLLSSFYGPNPPLTNFVTQPPCCGAALALEAWAIGGESVRVERTGPQTLAVSYDSVRWVYCAGIKPDRVSGAVYPQTVEALEHLSKALVQAGSRFEHVVRTWFYLGRITERESRWQRYQELNRARSDFYREIQFSRSPCNGAGSGGAYPASTGIGMSGAGLVLSGLALETNREDVLLLPLENPHQTPAYVYPPEHSPESPKFSRAIALALGNYLTTWISGTASILDSESQHLGDAERQTGQAIDNIERLIAPENFARYGVKGAGAALRDVAKVRVYLKRPQDFEKCKAICESRFGAVPTVYAIADICRPELLVEIEGVAFSRCSPIRSASRKTAKE